MTWKDLGVFAVSMTVVALTVLASKAMGFGTIGVGEIVTYAAMATVLSAIRERKP